MQIRKIKSWKEASKAANADADEEYHVNKNSTCGTFKIFGIGEHAGSWGRVIGGCTRDGCFYADDGFAYPVCVTEEYDEYDESVGDDICVYILCHGKVITDDEMLTDTHQYVHIRLISCNGVLYYYKTVSGEAVEWKIVGRTDDIKRTV